MELVQAKAFFDVEKYKNKQTTADSFPIIKETRSINEACVSPAHVWKPCLFSAGKETT